MAELFAYNERVETIFELIGDNEGKDFEQDIKKIHDDFDT